MIPIGMPDQSSVNLLDQTPSYSNTRIDSVIETSKAISRQTFASLDIQSIHVDQIASTYAPLNDSLNFTQWQLLLVQVNVSILPLRLESSCPWLESYSYFPIQKSSRTKSSKWVFSKFPAEFPAVFSQNFLEFSQNFLEFSQNFLLINRANWQNFVSLIAATTIGQWEWRFQTVAWDGQDSD